MIHSVSLWKIGQMYVLRHQQCLLSEWICGVGSDKIWVC